MPAKKGVRSMLTFVAERRAVLMRRAFTQATVRPCQQATALQQTPAMRQPPLQSRPRSQKRKLSASLQTLMTLLHSQASFRHNSSSRRESYVPLRQPHRALSAMASHHHQV